jgi:hypothetical protein
MPRTFAYVRISTTGQTTENQLHEIEAAGFTVVSVARRPRFWLSRAWRSRAIEVDIAIWTIDLAIIGCSG